MRGSLWAAIAVCLMVASSGCAGRTDTYDQLMYDRIKMLESTQEDSQRARQELEQENRRLEERVDALHRELANLSLEQERLEAGGLVEASAEATVMASVPRESEIREGSAGGAAKTSVVPSAVAGTRSMPKDSKKGPSPAEAAYEKALNLLEKGKPDVAGKMLDAFIGEYPKDPLVPNAHYWLGESHFDQDAFAEAILAFKKVPELFPNHHKAPDALFKIVSCYMKFDDRQNATFYLGVLLKGYPDARAAQLAKKRYADLL